MKVLLKEIFNHDFAEGATTAKFHAQFFKHTLTLVDLKKICDAVCASHIEINGKTIPAAIRIKGKKEEKPFAILAQLHGNEPAGLAGILLAMALSAAGKLERDVIGIIGNPLAAQQYFAAWEKAPGARQETRDAYRCGLGANGELLPDMNRVPIDFLARDAADPHIKRAHELYHVSRHICGIADIHSARGNLLCFTDHKQDGEMKDCPIRNVLTNLAEAISVHASASVTVHTWKMILAPLPNIQSHSGIEAGRHESPEAPHIAASFTLSLLHTLGLTSITPIYTQENGVFTRYEVQPRLTYDDLEHTQLRDGDRIYMAKTCRTIEALPKTTSKVIVRKKDGSCAMQPILEFLVDPVGKPAYAVYQYEEMEAIPKGEVVAVAVPSGVTFKTPFAFVGIFVSKSAALYDKDPAVGPWPVAASDIAAVKFCYPCTVSEMRVQFDLSPIIT